MTADKIHKSDAAEIYLSRDIEYEPPSLTPYRLEKIRPMVWDIRRNGDLFAKIKAQEVVAQRFVDCLNACRGYPSEALADGRFRFVISAAKSVLRVMKVMLLEKYSAEGPAFLPISDNAVVVWRNLQDEIWKMQGGK